MAHVALHARTEELLADYPPFLQDSQVFRETLDVLVRELVRIDGAASRLREKFFPHNADDEFRTLGMWEKLFGLPVEPVGATVAARRSAVVALYQSMNEASGAGWAQTLDTLLGGAPWSYQEGPADYSILLTVPYAGGTYSASQVAQIARRITPAHLDIVSTFDEGFLVGVSLVGDAL